MHDGQVYRLLSAIFVHLNLIHLIGNAVSTFILVTRIEYTFGPVKTLLLFLVSGIGGNIFSLAVDSDNFFGLKGGASTGIFGMIGVILGYIIINWSGLDRVGGTLRCQVLCSFTFMLLFGLFFAPLGPPNVDHLGHLGGFLTGLWLSCIGSTIISETREIVIRVLFAVIFVGQMLGTFLGFYLSH